MKFVRPDNRIASTPLTATTSRLGDPQSNLDQRHLLWASASVFTEQLGMALVPDWWATSAGECGCANWDGWERGWWKHGKSKRVKVKHPKPGDPAYEWRYCDSPGKHPCTPLLRGSTLYGSASFDMTEVTEWIARGCNLAAIPYGYIVIDIDGIHDGYESFKVWCAQAGVNAFALMNETLNVVSGSGAGCHLYFTLPTLDVLPPKPMDGWLPGVDIKTTAVSGDGERSSKATIPGSRHISGNRYRFQTFNDPVVVPQVLLDEIAAGRAYELTPESATRILAPGEERQPGAFGFGSMIHPNYAAFIRANTPRVEQ